MDKLESSDSDQRSLSCHWHICRGPGGPSQPDSDSEGLPAGPGPNSDSTCQWSPGPGAVIARAIPFALCANIYRLNISGARPDIFRLNQLSRATNNTDKTFPMWPWARFPAAAPVQRQVRPPGRPERPDPLPAAAFILGGAGPGVAWRHTPRAGAGIWRRREKDGGGGRGEEGVR